MAKSSKSKEIETILKPYNADIKRHIAGLAKKSDDDIKRYTGALSEEFQGRVKVVAEQYGDIKKTLDAHTKVLESHTEMIGKIQNTIDAHTEMIGTLMVDVSTVKANVEFLKGGLKKKVDYDEFLALERRLSLVEARVHK
jgi:hypothetical protein